MRNDNKRKNPTIFVDLDGTLVIQNYEPDIQEDVVIERTFNFLLERQKCDGAELVITTARTHAHCTKVKDILEARGLNIAHVLCDLSAGERILINDRSKDGDLKAFAINPVRNRGFDGS